MTSSTQTPTPSPNSASPSPVDRHAALMRVTSHEASHAVVAIVLGVPFHLVSIIPHGGMEGGLKFAADGKTVKTSGLSAQEKHEYARRRGIVALSGRIGEGMVSGIWDTAGAARDLDDLQECLTQIAKTPSERLLVRRALEREAREVVEGNWDTITRVAEVLGERKTISATEVAEIVAE